MIEAFCHGVPVLARWGQLQDESVTSPKPHLAEQHWQNYRPSEQEPEFEHIMLQFVTTPVYATHI